MARHATCISDARQPPAHPSGTCDHGPIVTPDGVRLTGARHVSESGGILMRTRAKTSRRSGKWLMNAAACAPRSRCMRTRSPASSTRLEASTTSSPAAGLPTGSESQSRCSQPDPVRGDVRPLECMHDSLHSLKRSICRLTAHGVASMNRGVANFSSFFRPRDCVNHRNAQLEVTRCGLSMDEELVEPGRVSRRL
jgi:hypothetical protein